MKSSTVLIGIVALSAAVAGVLLSGILEQPTREYLESRGMDERLSEVGAADSRLMEQITHKLGLDGGTEPEIDLYEPSEADIRFLMETFHGRDPSARRSAARALVAIQEPRAVGVLVRGEGPPEEVAWYCAGALEILRVQTRERAAEQMIDLIEDTERPPTPACLAELKEKLVFIGGQTPEVLTSLLGSDSARVRRYALRHLSPNSDPALIQRVRELAASGDVEQTRLAAEWLERAAAVPPSGSEPPQEQTEEVTP